MKHIKEKSKKELFAEAHEFLQGQNVGVLSTIHDKDQPHGATIFFYLKDDTSFDFYFFTHEFTEKFKDLDQNNRAALTVYTEDDPVIVQASGSVFVVEDEEEAMQAVSKLTEIASNSSSWFDPPISKIKAGKLVVLRVEVNWLRYADFRQLTSSPPPFHQIIP